VNHRLSQYNQVAHGEGEEASAHPYRGGQRQRRRRDHPVAQGSVHGFGEGPAHLGKCTFRMLLSDPAEIVLRASCFFTTSSPALGPSPTSSRP
jgi:hypothetical protein